MEIPKNIVQIGKPDKLHKIFVEDYVISYIKQLNRKSSGRTAGLAFYGRRCIEDNIRYYFLYGAAQVSGLEGRGQYLSELERESIEEKQREYFEGYDFLAWCSISGELPDGFYLHEQGKGLFINGYACFYEKNECMLNYMLVTGNEERAREKEAAQAAPDVVRVTSAGGIDKRMEERRPAAARQEAPKAPVHPERSNRRERYAAAASRKPEKGSSGVKFAVVTVAVLLCILGITTLSDADKLKELQVVARQVIENLSEKKLPDDIDQQGGGLSGPAGQGGIVSGPDASVSGPAENAANAGQQQNDGSTGGQDGQSGVNAGGQDTGNTGGQNIGGAGGQDGNAAGNTGSPIGQSNGNTDGQGGQDTPDTAGQEQPAQGNNGADGNTQPSGDGGRQNGNDAPPAGSAADAGNPAEETEAQVKTVTYVIAKGDTLLNICRSKYGSGDRLKEICDLNNIINADDIKIGQIILLPE